MNQIRYILIAVLLIVVGSAIYLGFKKFEQGRCIEEQQQTVNYHESDYGLNEIQADGKKLFLGQCASCHHPIKDGVGPALAGLDERGPWHDRKKLYEYIRNPSSIEKTKYIDSLRKVYGSKHMAFPDLTDDEISAILEYVNVDYTRPIVD